MDYDAATLAVNKAFLKASYKLLPHDPIAAENLCVVHDILGFVMGTEMLDRTSATAVVVQRLRARLADVFAPGALARALPPPTTPSDSSSSTRRGVFLPDLQDDVNVIQKWFVLDVPDGDLIKRNLGNCFVFAVEALDARYTLNVL